MGVYELIRGVDSMFSRVYHWATSGPKIEDITCFRDTLSPEDSVSFPDKFSSDNTDFYQRLAGIERVVDSN